MNSLSPPRDFSQFGFHIKNSCLCLLSVLKSLSALNNSDPFNPWCKIYRSINLVRKSLTTTWMDCNDNSYTHTHMRVCVYVHVYVCVCAERQRDRLVSFQKNLRSNPSHSNSTLWNSNTRSTPLKLIYIISSTYIPKIKYFEILFASL